MKHNSISIENSKELYAKIKETEYNLMYNKKTFYTFSDLSALTINF